MPTGFRETMRSANILSYRIFVFERRKRRQLRAADGISGARRRFGGDARHRHFERVLARRRHRLAPPARPLSRSPGRSSDRGGRAQPRSHVCCSRRSSAKGCCARADQCSFFPESGEPVYSTELGEAILAYLAPFARSTRCWFSSRTCSARSSRPICPGTTDAHPNWRRRLSVHARGASSAAASCAGSQR